MRLSAYLLPTLKENPAEAQIVSHRLMLRAGMIQQTSAGIYTWLPLGLKVFRNIQDVVRRELQRAGCLEILMPTLQPSDLWVESGRLEAYGKEMLRVTDRHEREMIYGPTAEELVTHIFRTHVKSYKDLPKILWNTQWKFRDEVRPRFGVMRGREFLMKDAYSFDLTKEDARRTYQRMYLAYLRIYTALGLRAIPMLADTGPVGGDLSHEFIVLAETGESQVFCEEAWVKSDLLAGAPSYQDDLEPFFTRLSSLYAATEEKHDPAQVASDKLVTARGIEVGHIFYLGKKYSTAMQNVTVSDASGAQVPVEMGCYGIGISRLVGAIVESSHDEAGIIWSESVAPFRVALINLKMGDKNTDKLCEIAYERLSYAKIDVLYDDRDERAGTKFADMDLIGLPWQLIIGPKGLQAGVVELKCRRTGLREELPLDAALEKLGCPHHA